MQLGEKIDGEGDGGEEGMWKAVEGGVGNCFWGPRAVYLVYF